MSYGRQAYARTAETTANPKEVEAQALMNAAIRLHKICTNWDSCKQDLDKELRTNRQIWTVFMDAITDESCPHPKALRENILNIGIFVVNRTMELHAEASPERVSALIGINQNIAAGLRGNP